MYSSMIVLLFGLGVLLGDGWLHSSINELVASGRTDNGSLLWFFLR